MGDQGNHFLELTVDDDEQVWLMLHSGSRNIGKKLAERHTHEAKGLGHNLDLPDRNLGVFVAGTPQMKAYLRDLYWAQEYPTRNRGVMKALLQRVVTEAFTARRPAHRHPRIAYSGHDAFMPTNWTREP